MRTTLIPARTSRVLAQGLILAAAISAAACAAPASAPPAAAPPASSTAPSSASPPPTPSRPVAAPSPVAREVVRFGSVLLLGGAPLFIAQDRGYFAEEAIDFELVPFDSGALAVAPTAAGQLEIAQAPLGPSFFNVLARGVPLTSIAATTYAETVLLVRKDLMDSGQVRTIGDLRGKRISFNIEGSAVDYALRRILPEAGVRLDDVELQRLPNSDLAAAMVNGAVDAGAVSDPLPIERAGVATRLFNSKDVIGPTTGATLAIGPSMLSKGDAVVVRFLRAYLKAMRDYQAARQDGKVVDPALVQILSQWTKIPADIVAQTAISEAVPGGVIDVDELTTVQAFWVKEGLVPTPVDLRQFIDTKYLDTARAQVPN